MVNIGKEIEKRAKEINIPVTQFAKKINTSRNNIYSIYGRKTIDTTLLYKISQALNYDFFQLFVDPKNKQKEIEGFKKQIESLQKENVYLKKINNLLEKGSKKK